MNNFTIIADNLLITFIDFKVIIAKYYTMQFILLCITNINNPQTP